MISKKLYNVGVVFIFLFMISFFSGLCFVNYFFKSNQGALVFIVICGGTVLIGIILLGIANSLEKKEENSEENLLLERLTEM